jgi:coenzyme PQQ precursor peptide PqqA
MGSDAGRFPAAWHIACKGLGRALVVVDHHCSSGGRNMTWTKPEFAVVELGMEVGAYAGNA